jgi:hypothetical protein
MKASHCDECHHGIYRGGATIICEKGHRPRFYRPTLLHADNWGWMRVCADYEEKPHDSFRGSEVQEHSETGAGTGSQ